MFEGIIKALNTFWSSKNCVILQGHDLEKGAATLGPMTFFPALDRSPCRIAYVDPCRRPVDSRFARNDTERYQRFFQYQVLIKPAPGRKKAKELFLQSLKVLDNTLTGSDLDFRPDSWTSPVFGAEGSGWEAWLRGSEIAQLTYFSKMGDVECETTPLEVTYGLERAAIRLNKIGNFSDIEWANGITYGELFDASEREHSEYNFEVASAQRHSQLLRIYLEESRMAISEKLFNPGLDYLLRAAHSYNIADVRSTTDIVGDKELNAIKAVAKKLAQSYVNSE